jgi:hypothetical protein
VTWKTLSPRSRKTGIRLLVFVLLAVHWFLAVSSVRHKSTTFDEIPHLTSGLSIWRTGDYRLDVDHPPPIRLWAALPVLLGRPAFPDLNNRDWWASDHWQIGRKFFYECGNDPDSMLFRGRVMMGAVSVALGLLVWGWSRRLFGDAGGVISLVLYAFSPAMLAHAPLVCTDMTLAFWLMAAVALTWGVLHRVSAGTVAGGGLAVAGLFLSKMSCLLFLPMVGILILIRFASGRPTHITWRRQFEVRPRLLQLGVWLLVAVVQAAIVLSLIWASYGFRYNAMKGAVAGRDHFFTPVPLPAKVSPWDYGVAHLQLKGEIIRFARDHRLLPEAYLYGLATTLRDAGAEESFFNGETRLHGWWYFFPYCFLVKTPLSALAIFLLAVPAFLNARRSREQQGRSRGTDRRGFVDSLYLTSPLWTLFAVYSAAAMASNLNMGERHILPVYPVLFVLAGGASAWLYASRRPVRWLVPAVLVLFVGSSLATWPHYLAHFNYLVGGPAYGYKHLVDSSLDWGQDLPGLKRWLDERSGVQNAGQVGGSQVPVYLSYFGSGSPSFYGIHARTLPGYMYWEPLWAGPLTGGIYCISATMLHQLRLIPMPKWTPVLEAMYWELRGRLAGPSTARRWDDVSPARLMGLPKPELNLYLRLRFARLCAFLRQREPDDNIGYSILIYRLSDRDVQRALTGKAVELVRAYPENLSRLADECFRAGIWSAAAICYETLLKSGPMSDRQATEEAFDRLGSALTSLHRSAEAVGVLRKGLEYAPDHVKMNNNLAWLLATVPADSQRDGAEALRRAKVALESISAPDPAIYDTMAAAYAELGQFEDACRCAGTAIKLAKETGLVDLVPQITARLELYRSGRPYREP